MRERIIAVLTWIRETWTKASKVARLVFLGSVAGVLVLSLVLTILLNRKDYVVLYNDLSNSENAQVIAVLNDAGIAYDVDNGRLLVESRDENRARLQLAVTGFENAGFNYDLANTGGLTATQQDKDRNTLYQLQNRLQATIELFPEISKAVVTISSPQRNAFALQEDNTPAAASITLQKRPGRTLTAEQVRGIVNIVRTSVPGLTDANISIVDERGDLKSALDLDADFNNKKLNLTDQVSKSMRDRIMSMVQPAYGLGNVEVVVMPTLNTDSSVKEEITYKPFDENNPTNNPLDYSEFSRQKTGDNFAQAGGVPGAQDNVGTPQYAAQEAEAANSAYYSSNDIYDYLVSSVREQIVKDGFTIEKVTASILINKTTASLDDNDRSAIIALAANASNIPRENITVQNIEFATNVIPDEPTAMSLTRIFIISGIALLVVCIILIIVLTMLSRRRKAQQEAMQAEEERRQTSLHDLLNEEQEYEPIALVESAEQKLKLQIRDLAESDPEIVAQLIKTWLVSN